MRISIDHVTSYVYDHPVRYSTQYLRLVPQSTSRQRVVEWRLETPGTPLELRDGYGNVLHVLTIDKPVREITIRAAGIVETSTTIDDEAADEPKLSPLLILRHTALTLAGQHGATAAELQARAGHASQAAMAIYQHATLDRDKSLAEKIGATYEAWRESRP